ncbi:hypothetical protein CBM2587_A160060 [Cupriavidus taiwanensis]|uniref:Uncharacterized protein n=1 Tax=Cupriavidus taiwanensis TaxID=164546 RepID=A0A375BIJ3_9BURK|nr:hypothetical protein CBM2587_A160060 [Cupriavidus taiwanensis]
MPDSHVHQGTLVLAQDHALERAGLHDREHLDRQLLVAAQREGGGVHHLQVARDGLVEADGGVARGAGILLRVGGVHAVDLGRLEHDLGADLGAAQRGRGVGGEERIAGAGGEDHHLALFQLADCARADIGLDHLVHAQRRLHAAFDIGVAHRVLQRQRVHHGGQHAHVVGRGTVHAGGAAGDAAEDIAAADHHRHLHAELHDLGNVVHHRLDGRAVDAEGIVAHQGFTGQFQKDALVGWHVHPRKEQFARLRRLGRDGSAETHWDVCFGTGGTSHRAAGRRKPVFGVPRPGPDHRGNGLLQCNAGCAGLHHLCRGAPCGAPAAL